MNSSIYALALYLLATASASAGGDSCTDGVPKLDAASLKTSVQGDDHVVALFDCSAAGNDVDTIVAVFAKNDAPYCVARTALMDKSGNFFLGKVKSVEVRTLSDNSIIVVPSLAGGEANHFWTSQAFLRLDEKCGVTQLAKFYSRMHYDEDDGSKCEGAKHTYKFMEGATVELRREKIHCESTSEVVTVETKTFDLDAMLRDPKLRILEP